MTILTVVARPIAQPYHFWGKYTADIAAMLLTYKIKFMYFIILKPRESGP